MTNTGKSIKAIWSCLRLYRFVGGTDFYFLMMCLGRCSIPSSVRGITAHCTNEYSRKREDKDSYYPGWHQNTSDHDLAGTSDIDAAFQYRSEKDLKTLPYWGKDHYYSGGGYVLNLGNTLSGAEELVEAAKEQGWLDEYTRAVFAEFNAWNANTNLFNMVIIVFEYQTTGLVKTSYTIDVIELYRYTGAGGLVNLLSEIVLLIFAIVKTVIEIRHIVKSRGSHLKILANKATLLVLVLYYTALGWYIWRSVLTSRTVEYMMNNRGTCTGG